MCGAFSIIHPLKELGRRFNAGYNEEFDSPRYNIRPSQPIPVILNSDPSQIVFASWGIHPSYDRSRKLFFINARDDSLERPTWKKMFQERRCLIPADGFYEWQKSDNKTKVPFRFELKSKELFAFAGLWHEEEYNNQTIPHCVIITTEPNRVVKDVHDRMPAILSRDQEISWLDPDQSEESLKALLHPLAAKELTSFKVSTLVNSAKNDSPEIVVPI